MFNLTDSQNVKRIADALERIANVLESSRKPSGEVSETENQEV